MYRTGDTIKATLETIERHDLVLPAIQREFVWRPEQICRLFDSLMQEFPIGTFLYWRVAPENSAKFQYYDFVRDYHQRKRPHCPRLGKIHGRQVTAVLDGQQRLTALNVGLRGSMAYKLPYKRWRSEDAFPRRTLHLDLLFNADTEDDQGERHRFSFLTDDQIPKGRLQKARATACWFPVAQILTLDDAGPAIHDWLLHHEGLTKDQQRHAFGILHRLYNMVHERHTIAYYEESSQELDKALQIFIRMNDGGTPLSHSDLLLSVAVGQWKTHDAREEIHALVDDLNRVGAGFAFTKDFVLKAGLMLCDVGSVGFKVDNFNRENMLMLENSWNDVKRVLRLTVELAARFGLSARTLSSHNALLPIAYYLHKSVRAESYLTRAKHASDRETIRHWLLRSLLKSGIWGSGQDTLLTLMRRQLNDAIANDSAGAYPAGQIERAMAGRGKSLTFSFEELEDLVDAEYDDRRTFAILSLIFSAVDVRQRHHVDHIFPVALFQKRELDRIGVPEGERGDFTESFNRLGNLQLLEGTENLEKSAKLPHAWLQERYSNDQSRFAHMERHLLGDIPSDLTGFLQFYDTRRERMKTELARLLGGNVGEDNSSDDAAD